MTMVNSGLKGLNYCTMFNEYKMKLIVCEESTRGLVWSNERPWKTYHVAGLFSLDKRFSGQTSTIFCVKYFSVDLSISSS